MKTRGIVNPSCPINWSHPVNQGLIGSWTLLPNPDWQSKVIIRDISRGRNPHDATPDSGASAAVIGGPRGRPGGFGCVAFDGTTFEPFQIPAPALITGAAQLTASIWIYPRSSGGGTFGRFFNSDDVNPFGFLMNGASTSITFYINGASSINATVAANAWNHVCGTYDGTTQRLYVNGAQSSSGAASGVLGTAAKIYFSDRSSQSRAFDGFMDDLRLSTTCLSAGAVLQLYNESRAGYPNAWNWMKVPNYPGQAPAAAGRRRNLTLTGCGR